MNTHTLPSVQHASLLIMLRRSALPFALFAGILAGLMALSWVLLLPLLTRIEVAGSLHTLTSLQEYRDDLQDELTQAEERRSHSLLAIQDPSYHALRTYKWGAQSAFRLRERFQEIAAGVIAQNDAVHVAEIAWDPGDNTILLRGSVRFVGPRCMTVLAEFVEALENSAEFVVVSMPRFERKDDPKIGPFSPFTISLRLR